MTSASESELKPEALVEDIIHLITLPDIWFRMQDVLQDPRHDGKMLADLIVYDHALTAKLLKVVNSSYFGFARRVDRLSQAIAIIGERELTNLVMSMSVTQALDSLTASYPEIDDFWMHSVCCALMARQLARMNNILHPERLFIAGLLHDMGKLVIYQKVPEVGKSIYGSDNDGLPPSIELEQTLLGFTHAEVGAALARSWNLPESLASSIQYHHSPDDAPDNRIECSLVHVANGLVNMVSPDASKTQEQEDFPFSANALQMCRIDPDSVTEMVVETLVEATVIQQAICGAVPMVPDEQN